MGCFEPLGLAVSIHEDLPFLTDLGNSYKLQSNTTFASVINEGVGEAIDYFLRATVWGVFIILTTVILLVTISVFYYCVKCLCYQKECHKAMLWGCGFLSILITVLCMAMVIVGFWAEVELNRNLANFISNSSDADAYFRAEQARHWMVIGYLILIALLLIMMIFCAVISPICKTTSPVVAMLVVFFVTTFLTSLLTGVGFAFLIILADICVGLSTITDDPQCMRQRYIEQLEFYCNDGYLYGFLLTGLGCGFIVMFLIVQIFGAFFAGVISGDERRNRIAPAEDNCNPTAPEREEIEPPEQFFVGGTQYQTSEAPQNTSRLSVDGQNDFQTDYSIMVLATNGLPTSGPLPPLYNEVAAEQNHSGSAADTGVGAALVAGNQNSHNEDTELLVTESWAGPKNDATSTAIVGVAYWAETTLDREFTVSSDGTGAVLGSNATFETFDTFVNAQRIRHWVVIGFLVVIILVLLLVLLAVILSPVCKGNTTFLKIVLAVLGVITVLTAVIAGLIFTITILHGDLCVTTNDLFEQVVDGSLCREFDNSVQNPQNQRFSGLLCQASVGELYELISSGSRCEDWRPFKLLDTFGGTNFCQTNISQLYQQLFQPLTFYCEEEHFCQTPVETLTSELLEVDCMATCRSYHIRDVFQVFCVNCSSFLSLAPSLCDIPIGNVVNAVVTFIIRRVCQECKSIGDLIQKFGSNTCSPDSGILIMTLCRLPLGDSICPTLCQSDIDELVDSSICQQQVEDYCSIIDSSICMDQPLLMRLGLSPLISYVNIFCDDALSSEFLLLIMVCVLIIALIIVQVAAAIYTTSFSADDSDSDYNSSGTGVTLKMKIFGRGGQAI